ncbi:unnamed protein product [Meganyctiphanes norvegica]|uniref:Uncharacterized protein n=2 Tax=Meganyctiphanes norvegica TaxID=48144 RepID=A0AAV2RLN7_MEGNR
MTSPVSSDSSYTSASNPPSSPPSVTSSDLQAIETQLDNFGNAINECVEVHSHFEENFNQLTEQDPVVRDYIRQNIGAATSQPCTPSVSLVRRRISQFETRSRSFGNLHDNRVSWLASLPEFVRQRMESTPANISSSSTNMSGDRRRSSSEDDFLLGGNQLEEHLLEQEREAEAQRRSLHGSQDGPEEFGSPQLDPVSQDRQHRLDSQESQDHQDRQRPGSQEGQGRQDIQHRQGSQEGQGRQDRQHRPNSNEGQGRHDHQNRQGHQDQEVQRQNDGGHQDYQDFYDQPVQQNDLSARWINQLNLLRSIKETDLGEMRKIVTALKNDLTRKDLQVIIRDIARMEEALKEIKEETRNILQEELVPISQMKDFTREIRDHEKFLTRIQVEAEDKIAELDKVNPPAVPQTPMGAAAQAIDTFRNIAKSPPMTLPTFDGTIIEYAPFKKKFMFLVEHVSGPPTLRATYLENSLRGEARRYMGTKSDYFGEYDEMWRLLDDKYANRWVLASDTIREFFGKPPHRAHKRMSMNGSGTKLTLSEEF